MSAPIHDDEPDVSEPVVRALLDAERPEWAGLPIAYLDTSGTDNAMWRVRTADPAEADVIVRLPRRPGAAAGVLTEAATLRHLETTPIASIVRTPRVRHVGEPHDVFPHHWSVLEWLDGTDAWTARDELELAGADLANAVSAITTTKIAGAHSVNRAIAVGRFGRCSTSSTGGSAHRAGMPTISSMWSRCADWRTRRVSWSTSRSTRCSSTAT